MFPFGVVARKFVSPAPRNVSSLADREMFIPASAHPRAAVAIVLIFVAPVQDRQRQPW
jgi:hypothetical protein